MEKMCGCEGLGWSFWQSGRQDFGWEKEASEPLSRELGVGFPLPPAKLVVKSES